MEENEYMRKALIFHIKYIWFSSIFLFGMVVINEHSKRYTHVAFISIFSTAIIATLIFCIKYISIFNKAMILSVLPVLCTLTLSFSEIGNATARYFLIYLACISMSAIYFNAKLLICNGVFINFILTISYFINPIAITGSLNVADFFRRLGIMDISLIFLYYVIFWGDKTIQELKQTKKELYNLAIKDELTGIYNRRYIFERMNEEIYACKRYGRRMSIMIIDIDYFKNINDTYGHLVGDEVLREVAELITNNLRIEDLFGRYGGEEFLTVLPETPVAEAIFAAERIRKSVEEHQFRDNVKVTISIGIKEYKGENIDTLIADVDRKLYLAKNKGRNRLEYGD